MNLKTPLLLAILCLGVGAFIFFAERHWQSTTDRQIQEKRLFEIRTDLVDRITIRHPEDDIVLEKVKGRWQLKEPIAYPANEEEIKNLLSDLEYLESVQVFHLADAKKDLERYGLKNPRLVLRANWEEEQIELRVGNETALTNAVYVQIQKGEPEITVVPRELIDKLMQSHNAWRDSQVLEFEPDRINKIIIRDLFKEIELQKNRKGWYIVRPIYARASEEKMQNLLGDLHQLQVKEFVDEDGNRLTQGLNEPAVRVQLFDDKKKERVAALLLGKNDPNDPSVLFARRGGSKTIFTVETNWLETLSLSMESYRDRKLARFYPENVTQIKIYHHDTLFQQALATNGIWKLQAASNVVAGNSQAIQNFLTRLEALEVFHFIADTSMDSARYGLQPSQMKVELILSTQQKGEKNLTLEFGKAENQVTFAKLEQEPFVVSVLSKHLNFLGVKPWDWKSLILTQNDPQKITHLEIKQGDQNLFLQRDQKDWTSSTGKAVDSVGVEAVVGLLSHLQAKQWLGTNWVDDVPLDMSFRWEMPEVRELKLWRKQDRTIGFLSGVSNWFFELGSGDATLLMQPLIMNVSTNVFKQAVVETNSP
jgi:hypothetical protein